MLNALRTEYGFFDLSNGAIEETLCSTVKRMRGRGSDLRDLPRSQLMLREASQSQKKQSENGLGIQQRAHTALRRSRLRSGEQEMKESPQPLIQYVPPVGKTGPLSRGQTRSVKAESDRNVRLAIELNQLFAY